MPLPICPAPMTPMDLIVVRPSAGASCCAMWSKMPSFNEAGRGAVPTTGGRGCGSAQFLLQLGNRHEEVGHEAVVGRSEEHTSELQSLMRISYAVFCLKKKKTKTQTNTKASHI